jgi:diguanylate cyclase (GGDEF)-like protein
VDQYHLQLTRLDDTLRDCTSAPDAATVHSCVKSLRQANHDYRGARDKAHQTFEDVYGQQEAFQDMVEELQAVVSRQDAQIDETENVIRDLDYQSDPGRGCRKVVHETSKLLQVNHHLRDTLDQVTVVAAREGGRLGSMDKRKLTDPLTELSNRAGLEACLADWWEKDPHRVRQLNAAMIDIDELGRVNERHGQDVGDRVLQATARILTGESRNHLIAARCAGQRFLLLFPDVDLRFATSLVERIRQTIELTHLKRRGEDIRITVSCAVTQIGREDTSETLYARAEATLHEAKRYGRNRTFLYEGKYPTPVVPPNFSLEEKSVTI